MKPAEGHKQRGAKSSASNRDAPQTTPEFFPGELETLDSSPFQRGRRGKTRAKAEQSRGNAHVRSLRAKGPSTSQPRASEERAPPWVCESQNAQAPTGRNKFQ